MTNDIFFLFLYSLACFRLSYLFVFDDGPFEVFYYLRGWAARPNPGRIRSFVHSVLSCVHCAGFYIALFLGYIAYLDHPVLHLIVWVIAVAGLQSIFVSLIKR